MWTRTRAGSASRSAWFSTSTLPAATRRELLVRTVAEQDVAREPEIRAVDLEFESDREDGVVLGLHRVGQRLEVGLARGVVGVRQELRNDAGRGGIHESPLAPWVSIAALRLVMSDKRSALPLEATGPVQHGRGN